MNMEWPPFIETSKNTHHFRPFFKIIFQQLNNRTNVYSCVHEPWGKNNQQYQQKSRPLQTCCPLSQVILRTQPFEQVGGLASLEIVSQMGNKDSDPWEGAQSMQNRCPPQMEKQGTASSQSIQRAFELPGHNKLIEHNVRERSNRLKA